VEDSPNLFRVSEEGWDKGSLSFKLIIREVIIAVLCQDRATSDRLVVVRGVLELPHNGVIVSKSKSGVIILIFGD
jgi:hypothetical protein